MIPNSLAEIHSLAEIPQHSTGGQASGLSIDRPEAGPPSRSLGRSRGNALLALVAVACLLDTGLAQDTRPDEPRTKAEIGKRLAKADRDMRGLQDRIDAEMMSRRGAEYLLVAQDKDGGWTPQAGPGVSCLILKALIQEPTVGPEHPAVQRGVRFVLRFQRDDGGFYSADGLLKNYETSVALSMFAALDSERYKTHAAKARDFLKNLQWDEGEQKSPDDPWYGGAGYGKHKRPDLSNTQMMLEALRDSGLPKDDPTYQKALAFIQRCQMRGESNDQPFARGSTQGGFIYTPANGGESKGEQIEVDGRKELRSYGTMTYAGFKSMLYAGLSKDDARVRAALDWIGHHWTLDHNPNMPTKQSKQGLYYYYHVFGRAFQAWGEDVVKDKLGREHIWRRELVTKLGELQRDDGSWINPEDRWMEGIPALTTAYAMLALQAAYP